MTAFVVRTDGLRRLGAGDLPGDPIDVVSGVLTSRFTTNGRCIQHRTGAPWFFVGVTAVVVVIHPRHLLRHTSRPSVYRSGWSSGSAGNSRIGPSGLGAAGSRRRLHRFPRLAGFNVVDCMIVVGVILLAWVGIRERTDQPERDAGASVKRTLPAEEGRLVSVLARMSGRGEGGRSARDRGGEGAGRRRAATEVLPSPGGER